MLDESIQVMINALAAEDAAIDETMQILSAKRERIQAALAPLRTLLDPIEPEFDGGLADACRQVLKTAAKPMSPVEVRDGLKALGYDLTKHKNEMASIHSVLKRMAESKESKDVKKHDLKEGTRYSWAGEPERTPPVPARTKNFSGLNLHFVDVMKSLEERQKNYDHLVRQMTSPAALAAIEAMSKSRSSLLSTSTEALLKAAERSQIDLEKITGKMPKL